MHIGTTTICIIVTSTCFNVRKKTNSSQSLTPNIMLDLKKMTIHLCSFYKHSLQDICHCEWETSFLLKLKSREQNSRKNFTAITGDWSSSKSWGQRCQRTQTPWWKRLLLGCKGIWRSGFSRRKRHSSHKRIGTLQLQALTNGACQSLRTEMRNVAQISSLMGSIVNLKWRDDQVSKQVNGIIKKANTFLQSWT